MLMLVYQRGTHDKSYPSPSCERHIWHLRIKPFEAIQAFLLFGVQPIRFRLQGFRLSRPGPHGPYLCLVRIPVFGWD